MSGYKKISKIAVSYDDMSLVKEIGLHIGEKTSTKILSHIIKSAHMTMQVEDLEIQGTEEDTIRFLLNKILYNLDDVLPEI